jgi:hypothetical protein
MDLRRILRRGLRARQSIERRVRGDDWHPRLPVFA